MPLGVPKMIALVACATTFAVCTGCGESSATVVANRRAGAEVLLLPVLRGGTAGWCVTDTPGHGCPVSRLKAGPIIAESWIAQGSKKTAEGFALTRSDVAAVAISGSSPITTRSEPGLPQGLRAAVVKVRGAWAREVTTPSLFGEPPHKAPEGLPRFTPLDSAGKPLAQQDEDGVMVERELAGRGWSSPATEPPGECELRAANLRGLVAKAGFVVARAEPVSGLIGDPFLSCASTSYSYEGWPLVGSVLVDAESPGSRPGLLPHMRLVAGSSVVVDALGSNGPMVARRVPGAWLVVSGGRDEAERGRLLEHLHATLHL